MTNNVQQLALREVGYVLEPLVAALDDLEAIRALFLDLGWDMEAAGVPAVETVAVLQAVAKAYNVVDGLARPRAGQPGLETLRAAVTALGTVGEAVTAIQGLAKVLDGSGKPRPADFEKLPRELLELLVCRYLESRHATLFCLLALLAIVTPGGDAEPTAPVADASGTLVRFARRRHRLRLDRIPHLLSDPVATLQDEYLRPGGLATAVDAEYTADKLFPRVASLFHSLGAPAMYGFKPEYGFDFGPTGNEILRHALAFWADIPVADAAAVQVGATIALSPRDRGGLGLVVRPFGTLALAHEIGEWRLDLETKGSVSGFAIGSGGVELPPGQDPSVDVLLRAQKLGGEGAPAFLVGSAKETRLEVGEFAIRTGGHFEASKQDFGFDVEAGSAALVVAAGNGDGFLQKVLPPEGLRAEFDLGIGWSSANGLHFKGAAALEATLPVKADLLGLLRIESVYLSLRASDSRVLGVVGATATVTLGPVTAVVERMGLQAELTVGRVPAAVAPASLDLRFRPPTGAALAIKAPGVEGGGYLFFDPQKEQYAGIVQLSLAETIAVKGVGLLTTRMPDGAKGFSLLVIISAEGFSPIPLGFGFTLTGIGGLLGINRTAAVDTLRLGLKNGTLESILFPADPVRDAPRVVSDAGAVFPPAPDRHVFGPMAKITWGTPTILTMNIGLVLEVPEPVRLLVLGRVLAVLPEEKSALISVRMDSLGTIDFATGEIALDAVLYDSRIANFALTGEMALRANWGEKPNFLLAIGGWNPRFPAPPGFPALARMALALSGDDPNARLRMEAYLAITSNTVQFGARLDFYFAAPPFSLEGRLGFDTLLHFAPFGFVAELAALLALRQDGALLTSVALTMSLSGPAPWHAWGTGQFVIAGVKQSFAFDARYGAGQEPALPAPVDVKALLVTALADARNWGAELPAAERPVVTLRSGGAAAVGLRVHPLAQVAVRERVAPLETRIGRFGNAPVSGDNQFTLTAVHSDTGAPLAAAQKLTDAFALAQFLDLSDDQKLALPAFTQQTAGVRLGSRDVAYGHEPALDAALTYETLMLAPERPAQRLAPYVMPAGVLDAAIALGAAAQAARGTAGA